MWTLGVLICMDGTTADDAAPYSYPAMGVENVAYYLDAIDLIEC